VNYDETLARIAKAETARAAQAQAVHDWYDRQNAAADQAVARAARRVTQAEQAVATAQAAVAFTDAESTRLWRILATRLRLPSVAALGLPPQPATEPVTEPPGRLLERARERLDEARPMPPRHLPWLIVVLAGVAMAVTAVLVLLASR
jgi:hypothetical protein